MDRKEVNYVNVVANTQIHTDLKEHCLSPPAAKKLANISKKKHIFSLSIKTLDFTFGRQIKLNLLSCYRRQAVKSFNICYQNCPTKLLSEHLPIFSIYQFFRDLLFKF